MLFWEMNMVNFFDLHCDTLSKALNENKKLYENDLHISLKKAKKYNPDGIIYIDLSKEVNSILDKINDDGNVRGFDNRITWPIRQAFTKAIISKKKQETNEG